MVTIRLARKGAKKRPFYHIVVADHRRPRDGKHIERLAFFNPFAAGEEERFRINDERYSYWLSVGAKPSVRVEKIITSREETSS